MTFVPVAAPKHPSPERDFSALPAREYIRESGAWKRCEGPDDLGNHLTDEADLRSWYIDETVRRGKPVKMRRPAETPIEILTTTFPPWLSDWTLDELKNQRDPKPKLAQIRDGWLRKALARVEPIRFVLGLAFHCDTSDPHWDLCMSRQDGAGGRRGKAGLQLVGPWCVATDRQVNAGAVISPQKRSQLVRDVANFRRRYGQHTVPLDVALARDLDEVASLVIGADLDRFRKGYAATVPQLERAHTLARLATLDAARASLASTLQSTPSKSPSPEIQF